MARKGKNRDQIIRIDGNNVFVEVLDQAFGIEKVKINFVRYHETSFKQLCIIPFYIDFTDFLVLEADVLSGRIYRMALKEKGKGEKYPSHIYMLQGGVSATTLANRGESRKDGKSLSRVFNIIPGNKYPFMIQAKQGAGEENDKGLIVSRFGNKPDDQVMVPFSADDLKKMVLMVRARINAYMAAQYVYFGKEEFVNQVSDERRRRDELMREQEQANNQNQSQHHG